jgi:hypothetical protein
MTSIVQRPKGSGTGPDAAGVTAGLTSMNSASPVGPDELDRRSFQRQNCSVFTETPSFRQNRDVGIPLRSNRSTIARHSDSLRRRGACCFAAISASKENEKADSPSAHSYCFPGGGATRRKLTAYDEPRIRAILAEARAGAKTVLRTLKAGEKDAVAKLLGVESASLSCSNLDDLTKSIAAKERDTRAFETTKLKYQQQKKIARSVELSIQALTKEIAKTKTEAEPEKKRLEVARMAAFSSYFALLQEEKRKIEQLYKPLQDTLQGGTDTDKRLVFEAQVRYRQDQHCRAGLEIIDRTRKGNFREAASLGVALARFWEECARRDFTPATLERELASIMREFTVCEDVDILIEDQLRESRTLEDFYNWLFDPTPFGVVSTLTFDDTNLEVLSPGQKGIILLMLYLEIDKGDYRPLIIDQPEENLDNLSVYKDVIQYFRDRKQYRQIIMVTHNPNLVINTDAEQVVVADYNGKRTPRLQYRAGSLEDKATQDARESSDDVEKGIIEQACNILEGGESALDKRQRKYQLPGHVT